jgi:hypothetical protein
MDLFTDVNGNHVVIENSTGIHYYLFSYNGTQQRSATIDNEGEYAKITGHDGTIYVVYVKNDRVRIKYSINAGQNWTTGNPYSFENSGTNGLDAVADNEGIYVTWAENSGNKVRFGLYDKQDDSWYYVQDVYSSCGAPTVTLSGTIADGKVHVSYNTSNILPLVYGYAYTKEANRSSISFGSAQLVDYASCGEKIFASNGIGKLYCFFYEGPFENDVDIYWRLKLKERGLSTTTWPTGSTLLSDYHADPLMDVDSSANGKINLVYEYNKYRYYPDSEGNWSTPETINEYSYRPQVSCNNNDIYVVYVYGSSALYLKQKDFPPLPPQNLYVDFSINNHPTIHWDANTEADLKGYHVYRDIPRISQGVRLTTNPITTTYYVDDEYIQGESYPAYYYAKAVDQYDNLSDISNYDYVWVMPTDKDIVNFSVTLTPANFELFQNYPNPFNPTTTINYALPRDGNVTISIYSVNGEKVKSVLNQFMEKGFHTVEWNGTNQNGSPVSTGIYIYELIAGDQRLAKKMFLAK